MPTYRPKIPHVIYINLCPDRLIDPKKGEPTAFHPPILSIPIYIMYCVYPIPIYICREGIKKAYKEFLFQ